MPKEQRVFLLMNICCGGNKRARVLDVIQQPAVWVFLTSRVFVCLHTDVCLCAWSKVYFYPSKEVRGGGGDLRRENIIKLQVRKFDCQA